VRNPFRIRASQRAVSDDEFVRLFGAGALDLMQSMEDPWGSLVFLRSAPGGGKTTFLRLLTPRPLRLADNLASGNANVKSTQEALREVGAIGPNGPELLGTMVEFTSEYRELAQFDRGNSLFRELVNSRIVIATLRAVLERVERPFPRDLDKIRVEWEPETRPTSLVGRGCLSSSGTACPYPPQRHRRASCPHLGAIRWRPQPGHLLKDRRLWVCPWLVPCDP
jgi:hypothetical protein